MEATNVYWEDLAEYLSQQGYPVSVVNPSQIKGFALSQLERNKNDKIDSAVIAQFCQERQPPLWLAPSASQKQLRAFSRHLDDLKQSQTQYQNRLQTSSDPLVRRFIETTLDNLQQQIKQVQQQLQALVEQEADLSHQQQLLLSIDGIGATTAIKLMAEMYDLGQYLSASAAAAGAGLTPSQHQSGISVQRRPHLSKVGKACVRWVRNLKGFNSNNTCDLLLIRSILKMTQRYSKISGWGKYVPE